MNRVLHRILIANCFVLVFFISIATLMNTSDFFFFYYNIASASYFIAVIIIYYFTEHKKQGDNFSLLFRLLTKWTFWTKQNSDIH